MTEDQARELFRDQCLPGRQGTLEAYGERAAVAAILEAQKMAHPSGLAGAVDLHAIAKDAAERVHKNGGCVPQLSFAPILFALQDALPEAGAVEAARKALEPFALYVEQNDLRDLPVRDMIEVPVRDLLVAAEALAVLSGSAAPFARPQRDAVVRVAAVASGAHVDQVYGGEWCLDPAAEFRADLIKVLAALAPTAGEGV